MKMDREKAKKVVEETLRFIPITGPIMSILNLAVDASGDLAEKGSINELSLEAKKQEITMKMAEAQAKVAQELAISKRIETADEVEIEEFYDTLGDGDLGVNVTSEATFVGAKGSGRKIVKRIYRFKGWLGEAEFFETKNE